MPMSSYLAGLRSKVGSGLLLLPSVAIILRDADERVLMVRDRGSESWGLPAGSIEPGETPRTAALRELEEESGIRVSGLCLQAALGGADFRHTYPNGDRVEYAIFVFSGRTTSGTGHRPQDEEEISDVQWFAREEAPTLILPYPEELLWEPQ